MKSSTGVPWGSRSVASHGPCVGRGSPSAAALTEHDNARQQGSPHPGLPQQRRPRESILDDYLEAIGGFIKRYPDITVVRLLEELRALGYQGGYSTLRQRVKTLRIPAAAADRAFRDRSRNPSPDGLGSVHDRVFSRRDAAG